MMMMMMMMATCQEVEKRGGFRDDGDSGVSSAAAMMMTRKRPPTGPRRVTDEAINHRRGLKDMHACFFLTPLCEDQGHLVLLSPGGKCVAQLAANDITERQTKKQYAKDINRAVRYLNGRRQWGQMSFEVYRSFSLARS